MVIDWILEKFLGVEISYDNLNLSMSSIISCIIVVAFSYMMIVYFDLFGIIENLFTLSKQPWYSQFIAEFSFLMISIRIFFLSLFTELNSMPQRLLTAFVYQFIGLIGSVMIYFILNNLVLPATNIPTETKIICSLFPYALNLVVFIVMKRIYTDEDFDMNDYFPSNTNTR